MLVSLLLRRKYLLKSLKFGDNCVQHCVDTISKANIDHDFIRPCKDSFEQCTNISIDNAIMEKTSLGAVTVLDDSWEDLGHWHAMWEHHNKDTDSNVAIGDVISNNNLK